MRKCASSVLHDAIVSKVALRFLFCFSSVEPFSVGAFSAWSTFIASSNRSSSPSAKIAAKISTFLCVYTKLSSTPPVVHSFAPFSGCAFSVSSFAFSKPGIVPGDDLKSDVVKFKKLIVVASSVVVSLNRCAIWPLTTPEGNTSAPSFEAFTASAIASDGFHNKLPDVSAPDAATARIASTTFPFATLTHSVSARCVSPVNTCEYGDLPANDRSVTDNAWHALEDENVCDKPGMACSRKSKATPPLSTNILAHSSVGSMLSIKRDTFATASARNDGDTGGFVTGVASSGVKSSGANTTLGFIVSEVVGVVAVGVAEGAVVVAVAVVAVVPVTAVTAEGPAAPSVSIATEVEGTLSSGLPSGFFSSFPSTFPSSTPPTVSNRRSTEIAKETPVG